MKHTFKENGFTKESVLLLQVSVLIVKINGVWVKI